MREEAEEAKGRRQAKPSVAGLLITFLWTGGKLIEDRALSIV